MCSPRGPTFPRCLTGSARVTLPFLTPSPVRAWNLLPLISLALGGRVESARLKLGPLEEGKYSVKLAREQWKLSRNPAVSMPTPF